MDKSGQTEAATQLHQMNVSNGKSIIANEEIQLYTERRYAVAGAAAAAMYIRCFVKFTESSGHKHNGHNK